MKLKADNHIHSKFSWDSKEKISDIVSKAEELNLDYIAITDHVEFSFQPVKEVVHRIKIRNEIIDKVQDTTKIKILKGVEISEPHMYRDEMKELKRIDDLDYYLGSIHHVLGVPLRKMVHIKKSIEYYLDSLKKMIEKSDIDTVAHIDYIKRYLTDTTFPEDKLNKILELIIKNDLVLEINSSGYYRYTEPFPSYNVVETYYNLGGKKVVYGSDAHTLDRIYSNIEEAEELNKELKLDDGIIEKRRFKSL